MNYKNGILSLAVIAALSSGVFADPKATYVPLTTETKDRAWVMFGVNDFSSGISSVTSTSVSNFTDGYDTVTDPASDNLPTAGFEDKNGENLGSVQSLDGAGFTADPTVAIMSSDLTFINEEAERSMYISIVDADGIGGDVPKIKLNYKANMEGRAVEIQINDSTANTYYTTINSTATFNNPAKASTEVPSVDSSGDKTAVGDVIVYDLSSAPVLASAYSKNDQGTPVGSQRFYHYDAENRQWEIWDRAKSGGGSTVNNFTDFEKGKAYWGRVDYVDNAGSVLGNTDNDYGIGALVLGKNISSSDANASVYTGKLVENSWNMISFDPASNPHIRNAVTGLIADFSNLLANETITVTDETGNNSVSVTFAAANVVDGQSLALHINETIAAQKFLGNIPKTFNVKAFASNVLDEIIFISDKKFTLKDGAANSILGATTLAGQDVFDETSQTVTNIGDVLPAGVTSVYGEYALLAEALVTPGTASNIDSTLIPAGGTKVSATIQFGTIDGDSKNGGATSATPLALTGVLNGPTDLGTAAFELVDDNVFNNTTGSGIITQIDTDFDTNTDMLLMASTVPFYIKDNTYTRVYTFSDEAFASTFTVKAGEETSINYGGAGNIGDIVDLINAEADDGVDPTGVYAEADLLGNLVIVSAEERTFGLYDAESATINYFESTTSGEDIALGAVKRVVDLAKLARTTLEANSFDIKFFADASGVEGGAAAATVGFTINGQTGTDISGESTANDSERDDFLDALVDNANAIMKANEIAGYASHDYVDGMDDITQATITIQGIGIDTVLLRNDDTTLALDDGNGGNAGAGNDGTGDEQSTNPGVMSLAGTTLVNDLKDNAVYTPDYVNAGPLYTLKEAGYDAKAILRPSTDITNTTTHWDHIDLTRASSDWLKNNEFNLFSVDNAAGYWAYIVPHVTNNEIVVSNAQYTPYYSYHFINTGANAGTTENIIDGGQFTVEITGIEEATSNVKVIVDGEEIELTREGGSGTVYSANITSFEASIAPRLSPISIGIKATDGINESYYKADELTLDYNKPNTPTVTFNNGVEAAIEDDSDATAFYIYKDFIPDTYASPIAGPISVAEAAVWNACKETGFGEETTYKVLSVDGNGTLGLANASDVTTFNYLNMLIGAVVLTNSGTLETTALEYDATCTGTPLVVNGINIQSLNGALRVSFESLGLDDSTATPWTVLYDLTGNGSEDLRVDMSEDYAGKKIYISNGTNIYETTLPVDETDADDSFTSPRDISTPISSVDNTTLQPN